MGRQHLYVLLLAAIALAAQASEDPTESLAGVHDLSKLPLKSNVAVVLRPSDMALILPLIPDYNHDPVRVHHSMQPCSGLLYMARDGNVHFCCVLGSFRAPVWYT